MSSERVHCDDCRFLTRSQRISARAHERLLERDMDRHVARRMQESHQVQSSRDASGVQIKTEEQEGRGSDLLARDIAQEQTATAPRTPSDAEKLPLSTIPPVHQSAKSEYEAYEAALTLVAMSRAHLQLAREREI
ncbi:hypothetical protein MMC07_009366 [Pseudocyphellaria aurata]|nr:hypothetical protein [Pseudocyphellaria aurata]